VAEVVLQRVGDGEPGLVEVDGGDALRGLAGREVGDETDDAGSPPKIQWPPPISKW
jgi:hypothetical protein